MKRLPALAAIVAIPCALAAGPAHAQTTSDSIANSSSEAPSGLPPPPPPLIAQPVAQSAGPSGSPPSEPVSGKAAKPMPTTAATILPPPKDPNRVYVENADRLHLDENDVAMATGNVRIRFRDYIANSGKAVVDTNSGIAVFSEGVKLYSATSRLDVHTDSPDSSITMNLRSGVYKLTGSESGAIPPDQIPTAGVVEPLYVNGGEIDGTPEIIDMRLTSITSCEFEPPHYSFLAETVRIRPGKRLIARHVTVFRHGHRLLVIPLIVLPLSDRNQQQNYIPQIGESPDEGYFAKFGIPYTLTATSEGVARVDLMSKKGVGVGVDQDFRPPFSTGARGDDGSFKYYYLNDKSTGLANTTASLTDSQLAYGGFKLQLSSQYAGNAYQLSDSKSESLTNSFSLTRSTTATSTSLSTNIQQSDYGFGTTTNITSSLAQHWATAHYGLADVRFTFSGYQSPGTSGSSSAAQQTLATASSYSTRTGGMSYEFKFDDNATLRNTTGGQVFGSVERLPELNIKTDSTNPKFHSPVLRLFPFLTAAGFSLGDYDDQSASIKTLRAQITANIDHGSHKKKAYTTNYSGGFEQDFYGDDTARYILTGRYGDDYAFGKTSHFNVTYQTQRPYGYTPFFWDATSKYDNAAATLAFQPSHSVGLNLVSGYDFTRAKTVNGLPAAPWQNLAGQLILKPNPSVSTRLASTFDINSGHLYALSDDLRVKLPWGYNMATSTQYSPDQHEVSSVTGSLTLPVMSNTAEGVGYKLDTLAGYNGFTRSFTYYGFQLTRSWHDIELAAVLQNNLGTVAQGTSYYLNLRLKAFPGIQPFGVGQFGQGISTGSSDVF